MRIDIGPTKATAAVVTDNVHDTKLAACMSQVLGAYKWAPPLYGQTIQLPFSSTDNLGKWDVLANIDGGGSTGQAGALRLAIARALVKSDESYRRRLRELGLLTRDARAVERKKPGRPKARKRFQFSKR